MITLHQRNAFNSTLDSAKTWGLTYEFIMFYKKFRHQGLSIDEATFASACEWDL